MFSPYKTPRRFLIMPNPTTTFAVVQRIILLALLAGLPATAAAQNYLQATPYCAAGSGVGYDTGPITTTNRLLVALTSNDATRTTSLNASATYGVLQASGSATAAATPDQRGGQAQFGAYFSGSTLLAFRDYVNLTSATLPPGTPVEVLVTENFQATVSSNLNYSGTGLHYQNVATHVLFAAHGNNNIYSNLPPGQTLTATLHGQVGGQIQLDALLYADGLAVANEFQTESAVAALTAKAITYVTILTPGASYYSVSGTIYPDSPNPPSLTVQLAGPDTAVVAWPASATSFTLQENAGLDAADWVDTTHLVSVVGTNQQVTLNPLPANRFFRLIQY